MPARPGRAGDVPVDGPVAFVTSPTASASASPSTGGCSEGRTTRGELGTYHSTCTAPAAPAGSAGVGRRTSEAAMIARYRGTDSWRFGVFASFTIEHIMARARAGEAQALETLRETGHFLARGFATIVKSVDPGLVYVGARSPRRGPRCRDRPGEPRGERRPPRGGRDGDPHGAAAEHPRLRGAGRSIRHPAFAAPDVSGTRRSARAGRPRPRRLRWPAPACAEALIEPARPSADCRRREVLASPSTPRRRCSGTGWPSPPNRHRLRDVSLEGGRSDDFSPAPSPSGAGRSRTRRLEHLDPLRLHGVGTPRRTCTSTSPQTAGTGSRRFERLRTNPHCLHLGRVGFRSELGTACCCPAPTRRRRAGVDLWMGGSAQPLPA